MEITILKKILKRLKPRHKLLIQKIDQEYPKEVHSKILTQECELRFKPKE